MAGNADALRSVIADAASGVALALRGGGGPDAVSGILHPDNPFAPAAVRVLGADVLAPYALGHPPPTADAGDAQTVRMALAAYPPGADASAVSLWSYGGLAEAARRFLPADGALPPVPDADMAWTGTDPWQRLAHRVSQLAALAVPGLADGLAASLAPRVDDLSRGFVRAVRRRDWLQAAGVGRWLARLPDVPETLGLDTGLVFVGRLGAADPRVDLHVAAAQRFFGRGR